MMTQEFWIVAREYAGFAEAGGVKDVTKGWAQTWSQMGYSVHVILPYYGFMKKEGYEFTESLPFVVSLKNRRFRIHSRTMAVGNLFFHLVDAPVFNKKMSVYTYTRVESQQDHSLYGRGYNDGVLMNLLFQEAAAHILTHHRPGAEITVHMHDGHTAFLPAILRTRSKYKFKSRHYRLWLTLHNAGEAYQQNIPASSSWVPLIPLSQREIQKTTFAETVMPLLSSMLWAQIQTVSPDYADQLLHPTPQDFHAGYLPQLFERRQTQLFGCYNGIEMEPYDPVNCFLPQYSYNPRVGDFWDKWQLKENFLEQHCPQMSPLDPLMVVQSRLTHQKGMDSLLKDLPRLMKIYPGWNLILMGQGDIDLEKGFMELERASGLTSRFRFFPFYKEEMIKPLLAAGDYFLMPSEFEPCGLTDLMAMLLGTTPVVHWVGGLKKNLPGITSYAFEKAKGESLETVLGPLLHDWHHFPEKKKEMAQAAAHYIQKEFSWQGIFTSKIKPWLDKNCLDME